MTGVHKAGITQALVAALVAEQFPQWGHLAVAPVELDGWDNTTFRLGEDMSVRLPSADCYVGQVDKEHRWLPVLAPQLPLAIPVPLARGVPGRLFPRPWSVYRWMDGEVATAGRIPDPVGFATDLAGFLAALYRIDPAGGPPPGEHSCNRGGSLAVWDAQTRETISELGTEIDGRAATAVWEAALDAPWPGPDVWVHGDVVPSNLLVRGGDLAAVIDFGCCAVGDPACDLVIAWSSFRRESREAFRAALSLDAAAWARGRGWALWKALITLAAGSRAGNDAGDAAARRFGWHRGPRAVLADVLADVLAPPGRL